MYYKDIATYELNFLNNQDEKNDHPIIKKLTTMHYRNLQEENKRTKINKKIPACLECGSEVAELEIKQLQDELACIHDFNQNFVKRTHRKLNSIEEGEATIEELNKAYGMGDWFDMEQMPSDKINYLSFLI